MKKIITGFILLLCYTVNLTAQETQKPNFSTDRPGQCFSSSTVPKGHLLLETGIGVDLFNGLNSWNLTATDLRYGVAKNFELRSGVRAFAQKRAVWAKGEDYWDAMYFMQEYVKKAFDQEGISIPFPQMDVHIKK